MDVFGEPWIVPTVTVTETKRDARIMHSFKVCIEKFYGIIRVLHGIKLVPGDRQNSVFQTCESKFT